MSRARRRLVGIASSPLLLAVLAVLAADLAEGQETTLVSVSANGGAGDGGCIWTSISADGRLVAFWSSASDLVPGQVYGGDGIYLRDRVAGTTARVDLAPGGALPDGGSRNPAISADGRFLAFTSFASNLTPGDTNGESDVFVQDLPSGAIERVSLATDGTQASDDCWSPAISADGRYVGFETRSAGLVPGDTNDLRDVFLRDRLSGTTELVSVDTSGAPANGTSGSCWLSADGRLVAFMSDASNLVPGDTNGAFDLFVRDRAAGTTERVSVASDGTQANDSSADGALSGDGRYVVFESLASNLVAGDTNGWRDVFVRDRQDGTTVRVSVASDGTQANGQSSDPAISADGRFVVFTSFASNLVPGDTNGRIDVFVHDRLSGTTERANVSTNGTQANQSTELPGNAISADGRFVSFPSLATNFAPGDFNGATDIFVRDRGAAFTTLCLGDGSGAPCGCGNEAAPGSGGGCANEAPMPAGQGARLSASGSASVAADDVVLTVEFTTDQPGLFFQGEQAIGGGAGQTFGDGLRCCGGNVLRLEIVDPPGPAGPTTVSTSLPLLATSPAGTTAPGDSRCYQWWYRNPGTSPCGSGFNLSNAVLVPWAP